MRRNMRPPPREEGPIIKESNKSNSKHSIQHKNGIEKNACERIHLRSLTTASSRLIPHYRIRIPVITNNSNIVKKQNFHGLGALIPYTVLFHAKFCCDRCGVACGGEKPKTALSVIAILADCAVGEKPAILKISACMH